MKGDFKIKFKMENWPSLYDVSLRVSPSFVRLLELARLILILFHEIKRICV